MMYFKNIRKGIFTTVKGLKLTWKHLWNARKTRGAINVEDKNYFAISEGHVTLQYPHQKLHVPDNGRYQLDCEIDDCIVCDKCAKVCPVDCIEIDAIKSSELIRTASDGSPVRLYAAKFDIDMAKCCFCGLCTTVCPTECLTMNSEYDFSVWNVDDFNFKFSNLTEEQAEEKRQLYNQFVLEKEALKRDQTSINKEGESSSPVKNPVFQPKFKPSAIPKIADESKKIITESEQPTKPAFTPTFKPKPMGFKPSMKPIKKNGDS